MSDVGNQLNYKQLLEHHHSVRIPMIQRDYAQGRASAGQVRDEFLSALESALLLPPGDPSLPMNLDFVYGSVEENEGQTRFNPLDGQQRLTTLFLLHWYLAWKDGRFAEFVDLFRDGDRSRFSYSVRPSSNEFFNELVSFEPDCSPSDVTSLSKFLVNQPWYFRSWRLDPTIQSVLTMLDAIHSRFADSLDLFDRLVDTDNPAITFQLLDPENFGLSDDLYIKMNARGKPLTPFETFKARYEQELAGQFIGQTRSIGEHEFSIAEFVSRRLDTDWMDLFWTESHGSAEQVDEGLFNVFRVIALVSRDPESEECSDDVAKLTRSQPTYTAFHENGWLDEEFTSFLIPLLEHWSAGGGGLTLLLPDTNYFNEREIFAKLVKSSTSLSVAETLLFLAYIVFIRKYEDNIDPRKMSEWLRVIHNLVVNSNIERFDRLPDGMTLIHTLAPKADQILEYLQSWEVPDTFGANVRHQAREEILKAQLLLAESGWRDLLGRAELHGYFRGQIDFLLDFSGVVTEAKNTAVTDWDPEKHVKMQTAFAICLAKAEAMFDSKGLNDVDDFLWARALIVVGDYLLDANRNRSLLVNSATEQTSWKRLLRGFPGREREARTHLKGLWSILDGTAPFGRQLKKIISGAGPEVDQWRKTIAKTPALWRYGSDRMIRFSDNKNIYPLFRTQMNGSHVELFSYSFYSSELKRLASKGQLKPLEISAYIEVTNSDDQPFFRLKYSVGDKDLHIDTDYFEGKYRIGLLSSDLRDAPEIKRALECVGKLVIIGDYTCVIVSPRKLEASLRALASSLSANA